MTNSTVGFFSGIMNRARSLVDNGGCLFISTEDRAELGLVRVCYSVGSSHYNLPDLYISAPIPSEELKTIANNVFNEWKKKGFRLGVSVDVIQGFPVRFDAVSVDSGDNKSRVSVASRFYEAFPEYNKREQLVPDFVQIVLPDANGLFPESTGYEMSQSLLSKSILN